MDISRYDGFFHDGSLCSIEQIDQDILITMSSAEVDPEDIIEKNILSENRIKGILHIKNFQTVFINGKQYSKINDLKQKAEIMDFDLFKDKVILGVIWRDYRNKKSNLGYTKFEFTAEEIYWQPIVKTS